VLTDIGAVRTARRALDQLDVLWRGRRDRAVDILAEPTGTADR